MRHAIELKVVPLLDLNGNITTSSGWGGKCRVTLLGDAAHALRPTNGQGASMALEDVVVLCRTLKKHQKKLQQQSTNKQGGDTLLHCPTTVQAVIADFESQRLGRVRRVWKCEMEAGKEVYKGNAAALVSSSDSYNHWLYKGV